MAAQGSKIGFGLVSLGALTAAVLIPGLAQAGGHRHYPQQDNYAYDGCERAQVQRGVVGALAGVALGAALGGNVAAAGLATEGAAVGGVLGGLIGGNVGKASAACEPGTAQTYGPAGHPGSRDFGTSYQDQTPYAAAQAPAYGYGYGYGAPAYNGGYGSPYAPGAVPVQAAPVYHSQGYSYDHSPYRSYGGYVQSSSQSYVSHGSASECALAESPIYLPDGRVQRRFVRVCRDGAGQFQVVE